MGGGVADYWSFNEHSTSATHAGVSLDSTVGGGVRIHPENARLSGRHGVQNVAQCVACAALTPVVWQQTTNLYRGTSLIRRTSSDAPATRSLRSFFE